MAPSVLEAIERGVVATLQPILAPSGPLSEIVVEDFFSPGDIEEILQRRRPTTPCGVLSMGGEGAFNTEQNRRVGVLQQTDVAYRYLFAMVDDNQADTAQRKATVYAANDIFLRAMVDAELTPFNPPDWILWPVRVTQMAKINAPKMCVVAWSFEVRARSNARATI